MSFVRGSSRTCCWFREAFESAPQRLCPALAAAVTTPLGMLVSYPMIRVLDDEVLGALLSLSAGVLLYVGATHLLPRAEREHKRYSMVALAGGVLVAVIIVASKS